MAFGGQDGRFYPLQTDLGFEPRYAGRTDLITNIQGEWTGVHFDGTYIGDYKTGAKPTAARGYPEWPLQLSLYRKGTDSTFGIKADGQVIFHLDKFTGIPTAYEYSDTYEDDLVTAESLVDFYWNFKADLIKRKGGIPSVTTILKVLDKPALVQWAANCTCDYLRSKLETRPSISRQELEGWLNDARFNFRKVSQTAMDVGTKVHDLIEQYLKHRKEPARSKLFDPQIKAGWDGFMDMWTSLTTEVIYIEARIFG